MTFAEPTEFNELKQNKKVTWTPEKNIPHLTIKCYGKEKFLQLYRGWNLFSESQQQHILAQSNGHIICLTSTGNVYVGGYVLGNNKCQNV